MILLLITITIFEKQKKLCSFVYKYIKRTFNTEIKNRLIACTHIIIEDMYASDFMY